jgi:hypothetical protein
MPAVGLTPSRAVIAEDVRDLQSWSSHRRRSYSEILGRTRTIRDRAERRRPPSGVEGASPSTSRGLPELFGKTINVALAHWRHANRSPFGPPRPEHRRQSAHSPRQPERG